MEAKTLLRKAKDVAVDAAIPALAAATQYDLGDLAHFNILLKLGSAAALGVVAGQLEAWKMKSEIAKLKRDSNRDAPASRHDIGEDYDKRWSLGFGHGAWSSQFGLGF